MKEEEIRPRELFDEYLRLSAIDSVELFSDAGRQRIDCPACGSANAKPAFSKHDFAYENCTHCNTLFVNPRPDVEAFSKLYRDSASSHYWANTFFPSVIEARRDKIFKKRVEVIAKKLADTGITPKAVAEIGAGHGIFLEEWQKRNPDLRLVAVEPSTVMAEICREKGLQVLEKFAEDVSADEVGADLVVCFEVLEHVHDPLQFLQGVVGMMKPGSLLLMTTLCYDGFDINMLQEKSKSISPPHHINFMSKQGFAELFQRAGLTDIEITTPGLLDVDIVNGAIDEHPELTEANGPLAGFWQQLLTGEAAEKFQQLLIDTGLSSHAWVWAEVP